jgi:cell division protein ZapE
LMDLFFEAAPGLGKRRVHFLSFMAEVHARLHEARREARSGVDPVARVAGELAEEARLLCFDEFAVFDIADATLLARLFSTLFSDGVVVVATSNVEPGRLYEGGRNRDLFLPFVALLQQRMEVVRLDARADFRLQKSCAGETFFLAADEKAKAKARARLAADLGAADFAPATLEVNGRALEVPLAQGRTARFSFAEICGRALGAADYLALAAAYDTIVVVDAPRMGQERRNEIRRFIMLVDILYEAKAKLILSAEAEAADLYTGEKGPEAVEFPRTVSRLTEMRSRAYLEQWAARAEGAAALAPEAAER